MRDRAQQGVPLFSCNPSAGEQDCFCQLLATAGTDPGPRHEVAVPAHPSQTLVPGLPARDSGSRCPLQVTWQLAPPGATGSEGEGRPLSQRTTAPVP